MKADTPTRHTECIIPSKLKLYVDDFRFLPAGKYHRLMTQGNMTEYAVLDMRSNHRQLALVDHATSYCALYVNDFKSAELRLGSKLLAIVDLDT